MTERSPFDRIRQNDPSLVSTMVDVRDSHDLVLLADALPHNTELSGLRLYLYPSLTNTTEMNLTATKAIAKAIVQSKLTKFGLGWTRGSYARQNFLLAKRLLGAVKRSPTIQDVWLYVEPKEYCQELIDCFPQLRKVEFIFTAMKPKYIQMLSESFQRTSTLTEFSMLGQLCLFEMRYQFSSEDMQILARGLSNNTSITTLMLDSCHIDDNGVKAFLQEWDLDSPIRELKWTTNKISAQGALLLIQAASTHPAMKSLDLGRNDNIGPQGIANIAMDLSQVELKELKVNACVKGSFRVREDIDYNQLVSQLLMQEMNSNTHLFKFDVSDNGLDTNAPEFQSALHFYTARNKYLPLMLLTSSLPTRAPNSHVAGNTEQLLPCTIWCHAFAKNSHNPSFIFHFVKELPMLWPKRTSAPLV